MEKWRTSNIQAKKAINMIFQLSKNYTLNKKKDSKTNTLNMGENSNNTTVKISTRKLNGDYQ